MSYDNRYVERCVKRLLDQGNSDTRPDLVDLARHRGVRSILCCSLPADGTIEPIVGGFRIYLRSNEYREIEMCKPEPALPVRVRFTLAHEIVHTFFYERRVTGDFDVSVPARIKGWRTDLVEPLCQFGAGLLLVPQEILTTRFPSTRYPISPTEILNLAQDMRVSTEVALRRLKGSHVVLEPDRCIIHIETAQPVEDWKISNVWSGSILRNIASVPRGTRLKDTPLGQYLDLDNLVAGGCPEISMGSYRIMSRLFWRRGQHSSALLQFEVIREN